MSARNFGAFSKLLLLSASLELKVLECATSFCSILNKHCRCSMLVMR